MRTRQFVLALGVCCATSTIANNSPSAEPAMPEDQLLTIPREDLFDECEEISVEGINQIKLYDRYPAPWKVIDITNKWIVGPLKTDIQLSEHELEVRKVEWEESLKKKKDDPFLKPTEEGTEAGAGAADAEADAEGALKTESRGNAADLTIEEVAAEIERTLEKGKPVVLPTTPRADPEPGQNMAVAKFVLEEDLDREKQSCLLHFNRGCFVSVYVNLQKAHARANSFCPLTIDISELVNKGENTIALLRGACTLFRGGEVLVAPVRYVTQLLVTTHTDTNELDIDLRIHNNGPAYKGKLIARISPWKSTEVAYELSREAELKTGETSLNWKATLDSPIYWSPDNPHLYELRLYDEQENVLWKERFGFRDFKTRGRHFFLNGKRVKLFGNCNIDYDKQGYLRCLEWGPGQHLDSYEKRGCYAYLKALKAAGLNSNIQYGKYDMSRGYFEACDELGVLAYVRFPAWGTRASIKSDNPAEHMSVMSRANEHYLHHLYNHASFVMISLGAELYKALPENLAAVYDYLKPRDKQQRPICSSSGRIRVQLNLKQKDKTDFADDHSYWGTLKGAWHWNRGYFAKLRREVDETYGKDTKPLTSFECLDANWRYDCTGVSAGVNKVMMADKVDRTAYSKMVEDNYYFGDGTMVCKIILSHGHGLRKFYTDEVYAHRALASLWRRVIEIYRQECDLEGWGAFHIERFIMYAYENRNTLGFLKKEFPEVKIERMGVDITKEQFLKLPTYYMIRRCYTPEFLSAKWFDRNLLAGDTAIKTTLVLNNDRHGTHAYQARALFRDEAGKTIHGQTIDFGTLTDFERKLVDFEYPIPETLPSGEYRLEFYLFRDGTRVNDNYYRVRVFGREEIGAQLESKKPVAVYLGPDTEAAAGTQSMLDAVGLKHDAIKDFSALKNYEVLILGAQSLDDQVVQAGKEIRGWIESGGRLLCFEQKRIGALPWLSEMRVAQASPNVNADLVEPTHPVFRSLKQEDFDSWNGNLSPYTRVIDPLNGTVVASAPAGYVLRPNFMKAVLVDVALNAGLSVVSQFDVTKRYGSDGVATILANNLLGYIVSDARGFSYTPTGKRSIAPDPKHCQSVDLSKCVNAGFRSEEEADEEDELEGGGGLMPGEGAKKKDLRNFPVGKRGFAGVPFTVISPDEEGDSTCLRLDLVGEPEPVPVKARFSRLFFLHTSLRCKGKDGTTVYSFTVRYADGKKETLDIRKGLHISDQPHLDNLPDSFLAWSDKSEKVPTLGAYVTAWDNPRPQQEISRIDFELEEEGVAILIAITGYWDADEHGWK